MPDPGLPRTGGTPLRRIRFQVTPLLVFALTFGLYLATLTGVHTFDALSYILDVQRKPWRELFHPHHLAYGPLGWAAYHGVRLLGYTGSANLPLQILNALAGAAGVALFFVSLRRIGGRSDIALACAALLGLSYAFWYYAVEVEVYTLAALFLIASLDQLARQLQSPSRRGFVLLGVLQGLAVLFHQTNVLLSLPIVLAVLLRYRRQSLCWILIWGAALAVIVGIPYLTVAWLSGLSTWQSLRGWLLSYATTGWWGGPLTAQKWSGLGEGLSLSLAGQGGALVGLLLVGLIVLHSQKLLRGWSVGRWQAILALMGLSWFGTYGAFFLWWEPDNIEFWIASLPPALLLLALALRQGEGAWQRRPGVWLALASALTLGWQNGEAISQRGDPTRDLQRQIVDALVVASVPDDLLLVPDGLQELYLPFYKGRFAYYSWNQAFYDHGPAWSAVCAAVRGRIESALSAGAAVVVADEVLHPPLVLQQRHGFGHADVASCLSPYGGAFQALPMPAPQAPAWRLPAANEIALATGWRFERFSWGWQGTNVTTNTFDGGWQFVAGTDPVLMSPRLSLDASRVRIIEIDLAADVMAGEAQLFWAGPDGMLDETHSLHWPLQPGLQTYRLDLQAAPGWQGTITRLRLDPVAVGNSLPLRLLAIRLRP